MQLKRLILYGRNDETRCVEFRQGELNIFTGDSKTGKTAVIDIVDYCLGSKLCNVAEGVIRDKVRYYALVVANGDEEIFICRPDPPTPQQTSHEIMVIVGSDLGIPKLTEFKPNFNLDSLKDFLSESLGIRENLSEPGVTRRALTANFRHALGFCFQEQGEIAQRGFLFHGSSDNFVALAIRDTLSYFLGAVEDERPALRAELRDATRTLTLAERRLDEAVTIGGQGFTKGITLLTEARQLGLDPFTTDASERSELEARLLAAVALAESPGDLPEIPGEVREQVNNERAMLMERIGTVSTQIEAYNNIGREESGYKSALSEQRQRLESIGLFSAPEPELHSCPVCGSLVDLPTNTDFESALSILSEELQGVEVTKPRLENVIRNLENERSVLSKQLASNRLKAEALAAQDEELRRSRDLSTSRARLAGRISFYLESGALSAKDENEALKSAVQRAKLNVEELQQRLDQEAFDDRLESILNWINRSITAMANDLQLEHSGDPLRFDPERLTIIADTINGPVPISRMGSGENWVSYHVLVHLALHQWFLLSGRPVPHFLILDQPSQVYFPADTGAEDDVDMNSVRRIYELILRVVDEVSPGLQVIIMDHVNDQSEWFQNAVVERWRNGIKLVPSEW